MTDLSRWLKVAYPYRLDCDYRDTTHSRVLALEIGTLTMRMTRKGHTHWKEIRGGKSEAVPDRFSIRLRQEQGKEETRSLTPEEIAALHASDRDKP